MALWRIRATVDDRPGYLSVLTASLALRAVNILAVQVHTTEAGAVDDFLVDAPDPLTATDLLAAVERGRGRDAFIARAEAQGLADQPTRALALAGRIVHDPDSLGDALATLLDAAEVTWHPDGLVPGVSGNRMVLSDPVGGRYQVRRAAPAFTPAEYARAQALVEVAGAAVHAVAEHSDLLLPDGTELPIRPAGPADHTAVRDLLPDVSDGRLRRLLQPAAGLTLLAWHDDPAPAGARVAALATLGTEGEVGEVHVTVAGEWRGRGIGTALLRRLTGYAARGGIAAVAARVRTDDAAQLRMLRRVGGTVAGTPDGGHVEVVIRTGGRRRAADQTPAGSG